jgi:hypothetical protein
MAEQMRPASNAQAPDPSDNYERSHPEHEAGAGRLDNNANATPRSKPDQMPKAVGNAQDGSKQLNAHENKQSGTDNPRHSMLDEEPLGWDQAPQGAGEGAQRHPRTGGKGGTPDAGQGSKQS